MRMENEIRLKIGTSFVTIITNINIFSELKF